jgi:tRNA 2-thiocytidine biosynthesis protein TtcA
MIHDGDRVLVGVSGGKDSLSLALALSLRRRHLPINYTVEAIHVDWREHALSEHQLEVLTRYFDTIEVPFTSISMSMYPPSFRGRFDCYLCARNRKRVLFEIAEQRGANLIAFGHHLDDIVETTLMNLCFRGSFATMNPKQKLFSGRLHIIRPLCRVSEDEIERLSRALDLPVTAIDCRLKEKNIRTVLKPIIRELHTHNRHVRENIYRSTQNINFDYLPGASH